MTVSRYERIVHRLRKPSASSLHWVALTLARTRQADLATHIAQIDPDAAWLVVFDGAIDYVIQNNPKARQNPRGLSQLDGYKRGLVNSLTGNLQKFGLDRVPQVQTLEDLLQADETSKNPTQDSQETIAFRSHPGVTTTNR